LRGLTSEDAIERTEFFLQSMRVREQAMCYIIHGHGTGVLKTCIRQYLSKCPIVQTTRPGQYYEGGDGVTLAWLKP
jgi:DNA mismatch repair protein MutS2